MAVELGTGEETLDLLDEGLQALRFARPSSFLAFFHDNCSRCRAAQIVSRQQVQPNRSPTQRTRRRSVQREWLDRLRLLAALRS